MSALPNEAKQETPISKQQIQNQTDLASFNSFGVATLSNGDEVNIQITTRHGIPFDRAYEDLKNHISLLDLAARDMGIKFWNGSKNNGESKTPPQSTPTTDKGGSGTKHNSKDPLPASQVPSELADLNVDVFAADFDEFVVEPKPDGKSVVKFFKDGLEFPVGATMNQWKHDTIKEALAQLTDKEINPKEAEKYRIGGTQYFVLGNEYVIQQGQHKGEKSRYKNLKLLKPIF